VSALQTLAHVSFSVLEIGFVVIGLRIAVWNSKMMGEWGFRATYEVTESLAGDASSGYYAEVRRHKTLRNAGLYVFAIGFLGSVVHNFF